MSAARMCRPNSSGVGGRPPAGSARTAIAELWRWIHGVSAGQLAASHKDSHVGGVVTRRPGRSGVGRHEAPDRAVDVGWQLGLEECQVLGLLGRRCQLGHSRQCRVMASNQSQLVPVDQVERFKLKIRTFRRSLAEARKELALSKENNNEKNAQLAQQRIDHATLMIQSNKIKLATAKARQRGQTSGSDFTQPKPATPLPVPVGGTDGGNGSSSDELESIPESAGGDSARTTFGTPAPSDESETGSSSGLVSASASFTGSSSPVPAVPSDESKAGSSSGLVSASASRGSRKPESSSSDPLRYSGAALGIRVMSAAESAERAAVEAADVERRANFFRANGLAP